MEGGVRESLKILKMHEVTFIEQMDWLRTFPLIVIIVSL